jgi:hypothetical protein
MYMTQREEIIHMVGLKKGDYNRNCPQHDICGESLKQGDLIVLRRCIIGKGLKLEACIAVVKTDKDGVDSSRVGFIAKDLLAFGFAKYEGRMGQVKFLIENSDNESYRAYSKSNYGAAELILFQ